MLCSKHNDILEELLYEEGHSHIIDLKSLNKETYFDKNGNLLTEGRIQFWKEVDSIIKDFDRNKLELTPRKPYISAVSGNPWETPQKTRSTPSFTGNNPSPSCNQHQQFSAYNDHYHVDNRLQHNDDSHNNYNAFNMLRPHRINHQVFHRSASYHPQKFY